MIRYHTIWVILCQIVMCLGIFIMACGKPQSNKENISSYYIPLDSLPAAGMVYTYRNMRDPEGKPEIWRAAAPVAASRRKPEKALSSARFQTKPSAPFMPRITCSI